MIVTSLKTFINDFFISNHWINNRMSVSFYFLLLFFFIMAMAHELSRAFSLVEGLLADLWATHKGGAPTYYNAPYPVKLIWYQNPGQEFYPNSQKDAIISLKRIGKREKEHHIAETWNPPSQHHNHNMEWDNDNHITTDFESVWYPHTKKKKKRRRHMDRIRDCNIFWLSETFQRRRTTISRMLRFLPLFWSPTLLTVNHRHTTVWSNWAQHWITLQ